MKVKGYVQDLEIEELDSKTEDLGIIYEGQTISEEVKVLRAFLKSSCEEANLKWSKTSNTKTGEYHINYEYGINIRFFVGETHYARFLIGPQLQKVEIHVIPRGEPISAMIHSVVFEIADPTSHDKLVELIKKMNRGNYAG